MIRRTAIFAVSLLLLAGCNRPVRLAPGTFVMRIAANEADHWDIIVLAKEAPGEIVRNDGEVVAEWLPVAPHSLAREQINDTDDFVVRETNGVTEVLVVHSAFDLTESSIQQTEYAGQTDRDGHPFVEVTVSAAGKELTRKLTRPYFPDYAEELYRNLALVIRGQVYALPRLEYEIGSRFHISATSPEQAEYFAAVLNGEVRQPPP